jgi:hypothetical protein
MVNHFPEVKSVQALLRLCAGNMKENAATFCEILQINRVEDILLKMSAFQIGEDKRGIVEIGNGSFFMATFLQGVSLVTQVEECDIDWSSFIFNGELMKDLVKAFFDEETWREALTTKGDKHRNLYLLLSSDNEKGVGVKIFD